MPDGTQKTQDAERLADERKREREADQRARDYIAEADSRLPGGPKSSGPGCAILAVLLSTVAFWVVRLF